MNIRQPLASLLLLAVTVSATAASDRFAPASFQLYYGNDKSLLTQLHRGLRKGQLVVIDTRVLSRAQRTQLLRDAERAGARVIGYLSVGELHDAHKAAFRSFLA